jgi:KDO2-lipid IV(A) lauroyltransferase
MESPDKTPPAPESTFAQDPFLRGWFALREHGEVALMRMLTAPMERASWQGCRRTGAWLGLLLFHALKRRQLIAINNVRLAFPELSALRARQIARNSAQNFGMTFCEFLHLNVASPQSIRDYVAVEHEEYLREGFDRGKGVILLTGHFGNWEALGARAAQDFELAAISRPTSNSGVQDHLNCIRKNINLGLIYPSEGPRPPLRFLRKNNALAILPDQYAGDKGLMLPMFGHRTSVWPSLSHLAMVSGATVIPAWGVRQKPWMSNGKLVAKLSSGYQITPGDDKDQAVLDGTKRMIHELETIVRQYPEQWMWLHRRWRKEDLQHEK